MMATSVVRARLAATVSLVALSLATPTLADQAQEQAATIDDIIVTAQKREQSIQSVPIAVSAFSAETLDAMKIEGGSELLRAVPNVSFSKNNFSMYNFSIRGVGTKSISSASDPAVAVSFNSSPMIRNRLFESEYLDVKGVEVLRGPQGTLYGRNATAGVVNMIPNLPGFDFESYIKAEVGNYGTVRGQLMFNLPLSDTFALRVAASSTKRDGFDYNEYNNTRINNRDLWSTRVSALWEPSDRFNANFIWERFSEDDNRGRTGKQLCSPDEGPSMVGSARVPHLLYQGRLSQGCSAKSLYDESSNGVPNGAALAFVFPANVQVGYTGLRGRELLATVSPYDYPNPYAGVKQPEGLRRVSTYFDPEYKADNDVYQLNLTYNISDNIKLFSQTLYTTDKFKASQDYNRFVSNPIFEKHNYSGVTNQQGVRYPEFTAIVNGFYTDPQLGASDRIISKDLSRSDNEQKYQELRLQSDFEGKFNFLLGANYLEFETKDDYFVFNNMFTFISDYFYNVRSIGAASGVVDCVESIKECVYVDRSPISDLVGDGHNYFRSKNEVSTRSFAVFGEAYWKLTDQANLTVGLRYTDDTKRTTPYPSQLLLGAFPNGNLGIVTGGYHHRGYPADAIVKQDWQVVTGRAVLDYKLNDSSMLYASYARGYKGGGTNPPRADINPAVVQYQYQEDRFDPEFIDAFEIGYKARLADNRIRLSANAFFYDYKDYQVSQIVDRISLNENFDAVNYGAEFEAVYLVNENWRIDANLGLLKTRVKGGESSIDVMNRTQGNQEWTLVRPWLQVPSNCIAPTKNVEKILNSPMFEYMGIIALSALCSGSTRNGTFTPGMTGALPLWQYFNFEYNPLKDAPNGGRGFEADLTDNELPNAPRYTANIGIQYDRDVMDWSMTLRADYYRQAESYFRVYNTEYDKLRSWGNLNLMASLESNRSNWVVSAYVKNVLNDSPIVDAFTNSDDSLLSTNVFTLDPRIIGFSVSARF